MFLIKDRDPGIDTSRPLVSPLPLASHDELNIPPNYLPDRVNMGNHKTRCLLFLFVFSSFFLGKYAWSTDICRLTHVWEFASQPVICNLLLAV